MGISLVVKMPSASVEIDTECSSYSVIKACAEAVRKARAEHEMSQKLAVTAEDANCRDPCGGPDPESSQGYNRSALLEKAKLGCENETIS